METLHRNKGLLLFALIVLLTTELNNFSLRKIHTETLKNQINNLFLI